MDYSRALDVITGEAAAFVELISDDAQAVPVAGCPGWSVGDLARHLGGVHRWAREAVLVGESREETGPDEPAALRSWFRHGAAELVATLADVGPDHPCWTFAPPATAWFWMRRQAHETTLHRWDAATSLGLPAPLDDAIAVDGLREVTDVLLSRQVRLRRLAPSPHVVRLDCASGTDVMVETGSVGDPDPASPDPASPDPAIPAAVATISGPAEVLYLLLWRRVGLTDARLEVTGDAGAAAELLSGALTP